MKIEEEINEQRFLDVQSQLTKFKRENENLKSFVKEYMQKKTDDISDDEDIFSNEEIQIEKNWRENFLQKFKNFLEGVDKENEFHQTFGLDHDASNAIFLDFEMHFNNLNWRSEPKIYETEGNRFLAQSCLLATLFWMRQYPTTLVLKQIFGVHQRTLARIFKRTLTALESTFQEELKWPSDGELLSWKITALEGTELEDIVCFADGTILHGPRSILKFAPGQWDPFFCSHKHKHGVNIVCVVNYQGKILWSTNWERGSSNDQGISNRNNLRQDFIGKSYGIAADGGFTFNRKEDPNKIITAKPYPYKETMEVDQESQNKKEFNKLLSSNRVIVENVFARLKQWRIIGGFMRHFHPNDENKANVIDLNVLFQVLCTLHNRDLEFHPMRKNQ